MSKREKQYSIKPFVSFNTHLQNIQTFKFPIKNKRKHKYKYKIRMKVSFNTKRCKFPIKEVLPLDYYVAKIEQSKDKKQRNFFSLNKILNTGNIRLFTQTYFFLFLTDYSSYYINAKKHYNHIKINNEINLFYSNIFNQPHILFLSNHHYNLFEIILKKKNNICNDYYYRRSINYLSMNRSNYFFFFNEIAKFFKKIINVVLKRIKKIKYRIYPKYLKKETRFYFKYLVITMFNYKKRFFFNYIRTNINTLKTSNIHIHIPKIFKYTSNHFQLIWKIFMKDIFNKNIKYWRFFYHLSLKKLWTFLVGKYMVIEDKEFSFKYYFLIYTSMYIYHIISYFFGLKKDMEKEKRLFLKRSRMGFLSDSNIQIPENYVVNMSFLSS